MQQKLEMFENRLSKVYKHLSKLALKQNLECFRIYDKDLPEFPLIIEQYGNQINVAEYKSNHKLTDEVYELWLQNSLTIISKVTQIDIEKIHLKLRKRIIDRVEQYQKNDEKKQFFEVKENGLKFKINLTDFLDTGLFLDHRITRKMVMEESQNKKVLNLFCYTGSFSVYAAAGGATEVVSIDLSNTYINWTKENMQINGFVDEAKYKNIKADVLQYIDQLPNNHFDIVVLDPPTFSNSKMMKTIFDVQAQHVDLINQLLQKMTANSTMYFSNNFTKFILDANAISASTIKDITKATTPFDFEKKLQRWCFKITK
jgi:23S rRNA (cytosine1962-C5)-methyltransferase